MGRSFTSGVSLLLALAWSGPALAGDDEGEDDETVLADSDEDDDLDDDSSDEDSDALDDELDDEGDPLDDVEDWENPFQEDLDASRDTKTEGRFRFGVAGGGGLIAWDGPTLTYGGLDLRLGYQVNDLVGVYAQPQLGYYQGDFDGVTGAGGLLGASAVVDFTFSDRAFVGAGLGYAVLNDPGGAELQLRLGGYPLVDQSQQGPRRRGLMVGVDLRLHFVDSKTFFAPTLAVGYEAF